MRRNTGWRKRPDAVVHEGAVVVPVEDAIVAPAPADKRRSKWRLWRPWNQTRDYGGPNAPARTNLQDNQGMRTISEKVNKMRANSESIVNTM